MLKIIVFTSFFMLASCLWKSNFWSFQPQLNSKGQVVASSNEVTITAVEKSQTFEPAEIIAQPGQKIKLKVVNALKSSPVNFLVLQAGDDPVVVSQLVLQKQNSKQKDSSVAAWLPDKDYFLGAIKKVLSPSQSERISLQMPTEEGIYYFVSTYPGQAENLQGKIIVQGPEETEEQTAPFSPQVSEN